MQNIILTPIAVPELVDLIACEIEARWINKNNTPQDFNPSCSFVIQSVKF